MSHVVVDEIHERDINTDFLLVMLRDMVNAFPDMRVVLMSATVDTSMFAEYFGKTRIVEVYGRQNPIKRECTLGQCSRLSVKAGLGGCVTGCKAFLFCFGVVAFS